MTAQSAPISRDTLCAARDSRLMPNSPPSRCVPVGVMYPLLVDTVNEHNLNGLDVKVTIPCLNSINKCVPQSFSCAWERQAKFAAASGPHQDVYDLHDVIM